MTKSATPKWPETRPAPDDYLIALGVVTLRFNRLELLLSLLLLILGRDGVEVSIWRFENQDTRRRLDSLKRLAKARFVGAKGTELIEALSAGYDACAHNRNILSHANISPPNPNALGASRVLLGYKYSKRGNEQHFVFTTDSVRQVADQIGDWANFTARVFQWFRHQFGDADQAEPLPDVPEVPTKMEGSPPLLRQATIPPPPPSTE